MVTKGQRWGRDKLGVWDEQIPLYTKYINNKDLLHSSTGNYIQYLVITYNRKESEKNMCITESLCCIPETNTIL